MMLWTIYDHPTDFPNHFVVRKWGASLDGVTPHMTEMFDTLEEARDSLRQRGLMRIPRDALDDAKIVETWL